MKVEGTTHLRQGRNSHPPRVAEHSEENVRNRNISQGLATGGWHRRQRNGHFERWTNPKRPRRTCSHQYRLQYWTGKSTGVAKRPRERSPTRNPQRFAFFPSQQIFRLSHPRSLAVGFRATDRPGSNRTCERMPSSSSMSSLIASIT